MTVTELDVQVHPDPVLRPAGEAVVIGKRVAATVPHDHLAGVADAADGSGPVRHVYRLTASGAELAGALRVLTDWGAAQRGRTPRSADDHDRDLIHAACGTPVEARWYCPTCDRQVDEPGADGLQWM